MSKKNVILNDIPEEIISEPFPHDVEITLNPSQGVIGTVQDPKNLDSSTTILSSSSSEPLVVVSKENTSQDKANRRRMRRTTFQARLGRKLDKIHREVLDNELRLSSHPTDMLRISITRDPRSRDIVSRTLESTEVMPVVFPKIESIPMRHLEGYREGNEVTIPSLYTIDTQEYFEIYTPVGSKLKPDDLLVRIVYDDVECPNDPYVMIMQVTEQLATIGYSSIRYYKYFCTYYNENLPQRIVDTIKSDQIKRSLLGW